VIAEDELQLDTVDDDVGTELERNDNNNNSKYIAILLRITCVIVYNVSKQHNNLSQVAQ